MTQSGNEGAVRKHAKGLLSSPSAASPEIVKLEVGEFENIFNLQIWKNFFDQFEIVLISLGGITVGPIPERLGTQRFSIGPTEILF